MSNTTTIKSGAWFYPVVYCRSAYRVDWSPMIRDYAISFRLGLDPVQPQHIILRGGSWISAGCRARSAYRDGYGPGLRARDAGLRLGLTTRIER